jgi:hypothetical protein
MPFNLFFQLKKIETQKLNKNSILVVISKSHMTNLKL